MARVVKWIARSKFEEGKFVTVANEREAIAVSPTRNGSYGVIIKGKYIKASPKRIYPLEQRERRNAVRRAARKQLTSV